VAEAASAAPATRAASRRTLSTWLTPYPRPLDRTRMSRPKASALTGTAELNATIERVAPAVLELLADGTPRTKAAITKALAGRHAEDDVALALIRLAVTGRVEDTGGRYTLASEPAPDVG